MKSTTFYKYIIGILVLLNILILTFFVMTRPPAPRRFSSKDGKKFERQAIQILKLDQKQQQVFLESARQHAEAMIAINQEQKKLLKPYFHGLINEVDSMQARTAERNLDKIEALERKKIEITYQHFEAVKNHLNEVQKTNFKTFMDKVLVLILLE